MDCLVRLYDLPNPIPNEDVIIVRRVMSYEKSQLLAWIKTNFTQQWADECSLAFTGQPIKCFIALMGGKILGFSCYDCTQKNFFGPMGIQVDNQRQGIGKKLLITALQSMRMEGYAYAIIGDCEKELAFYQHCVNAIIIENSTPGIYANRILEKG